MTWLAHPFLLLRFFAPMLLAWQHGGRDCVPVWVHDLREGVAVFASPVDQVGNYAEGEDYYTVPAAQCDEGAVTCTGEACDR